MKNIGDDYEKRIMKINENIEILDNLEMERMSEQNEEEKK